MPKAPFGHCLPVHAELPVLNTHANNTGNMYSASKKYKNYTQSTNNLLFLIFYFVNGRLRLDLSSKLHEGGSPSCNFFFEVRWGRGGGGDYVVF